MTTDPVAIHKLTSPFSAFEFRVDQVLDIQDAVAAELEMIVPGGMNSGWTDRSWCATWKRGASISGNRNGTGRQEDNKLPHHNEDLLRD